MTEHATAEHERLAESPDDTGPWRLWGPYVSGRQWGTVREDYSADGDAWSSFPFDQAHLRAYRWGEDGLAGICDRYGFLNLAVAFWNGQDDRLKERYFGLTNAQGNHGEDVKEYWWHLDATPTHSHARWLYRYPQAAFPYDGLVAESGRRGRQDDEYELADTGVLDGNRFFDVEVTHAKAGPDDLCIRITATNHGPEPAPLDVVPQLWFRNTWRWGRDDRVPVLRRVEPPIGTGYVAVEAVHGFLGRYLLSGNGAPEVMFCDNETDRVALWGAADSSTTNPTPYPKSGIDRAVVHGDRSLLNPAQTGTKAALRYHFDAVAPGQTVSIDLRLASEPSGPPFGAAYQRVLEDRSAEADAFYDVCIPASVSADDRLVARRAFAGLLWCRQLYRYDVRHWLEGDAGQPVPPPERLEPTGRNTSWRHLYLADVISMPDEWEYPWFASWDLAFHCVTLAHIDPALAKAQLILMCREWVQHPDGQLPAYEWAFGDVNPPVHAWAAWQVYLLDGARDHGFLVRVFGKLLLNFGWWVNRKDADGSDLFEGGFLGMDNIAAFDRSKDVPPGWRLEQSDATSWMAFFCLSMLRMALELARVDPSWDDLATTFLERFVSIAEAMDSFGSSGVSLWDEDDGFFYDVLVSDDGQQMEKLRVRSMVGLLPLLAVAPVPDWVTSELPDFTSRLRWLHQNQPGRISGLVGVRAPDGGLTLSLLSDDRVRRLLGRLLDEGEFLSPYGVRSLSAAYRGGVTVSLLGRAMSLSYDPGESTSGLFGGNSNWRGPVWLPVNVLLADALRTFGSDAATGLRVPLPTGSDTPASLAEVADLIEERLIALFRPDAAGHRPGDQRDRPEGPLWTGHPTFSEYFHGDTGRGLGASHQTGWTALVAHLICVRAPHA